MTHGSQLRVLSICDWLPPDFGAVGQYALLEARKAAERGAAVTLVGLSSSEDSTAEERVGEGRLRVVRVFAPAYDRANFRRRLLWTLRTNLRLLRRTAPFAHDADETIFTGSPPFLLHFIVPANRFRRRRLTYRITDFHPECLMAELGRSPLWLRLLHRRTLRLRRRVDRFEVLGEDQGRRLIESGIPAERIVLRRDESPVVMTGATEALPLPGELAGKVVLLYSGNFGVAHDDETFIAGYERHHRAGSGRVVLWLNATGAKADRVEAKLRAAKLPLCRSRPGPLSELARLLVTPAAHLITLRDEFVGYVLPSKVYGCIASGRAVLFVGSAASDVHALCDKRLPAGQYRRVASGDSNGVAAALEEIADRQNAPKSVSAVEPVR